MDLCLLAQSEPQAFPWVTVLSILGPLLVTGLGGLFLHVREVRKIRSENAAEREKIAAALATAGITAETERGKHKIDQQKQGDDHDEKLLDKFLTRIDILEKKIDDERKECVKEIKEVRAAHIEALKLHADAMRRIGQLEAGQKRQAEDSVNVCREVAKIKTAVEAIPAAPTVITLNVGPEHAETEPPKPDIYQG